MPVPPSLILSGTVSVKEFAIRLPELSKSAKLSCISNPVMPSNRTTALSVEDPGPTTASGVPEVSAPA